MRQAHWFSPGANRQGRRSATTRLPAGRESYTEVAADVMAAKPGRQDEQVTGASSLPPCRRISSAPTSDAATRKRW